MVCKTYAIIDYTAKGKQFLDTPLGQKQHHFRAQRHKQQQQQTQADHDTDHKPKTISDTGPETPKLLILILPQNYLVYFPLSPSPENY